MQLVEDTLWKRLVVTLGTKTTEIEVDLEDQVQEDILVLFKLKDQQVQETLEVTVRQKEILEEQGDLLETLVAAVEVAQVLSVQTTAEPLEETAVLEL